ncbi:S41 family peptidase [Bernardetia sp. OM2101]|uniref:S41 family peptidase n=1 Tax=Bernardetia sp. OM2101 TaxID=3344876 RepID=UPI0035CEA706
MDKLESYKQFGLIWGFLKYHHPKISAGKYSWNEVFLKAIDSIDNIQKQSHLDNYLIHFIDTYDKKANYKKSTSLNRLDTTNLFTKNVNYKWIDSVFTNEQIRKKLRTHLQTPSKNYYFSSSRFNLIPTFDNEKAVPHFDYKLKKYRVLFFFSFWNMIAYCNVNKYLTDNTWESQLVPYLKEFILADSEFVYEKAKAKLIASLNDSHAYYLSLTLQDTLFQYKPIINVALINDTLVVTDIWNKTLAQQDDIQLGDLILEIEGVDIKSRLNENVGEIISCSNESFKKKWARWILFNDKDSIRVKVNRGGIVRESIYHLYDDNNIKGQGYTTLYPKPLAQQQFITEKIGYINPYTISKKDLKKVFKKFKKTDGLIIDMRCYPKYISETDFANFLYPDKTNFIKIIAPVKGKPSYANMIEAPLGKIINPFRAGKRNPNFYKGKVILLVNHATQSRAEYISVAIQASPNCITIGEPTAGSIMNIATFTTPDGTTVSFTSLGAFYPNGEEIQRKGIKIDVLVEEHTSSLAEEEYIQTAIKLITTSSKP